MNPWNRRKTRLLRERGGMCEYCNVSRATDLDHAVYPKAVGKRIDDDENLILLCRSKECHGGKPEGYRNWAWKKNCERYGAAHMLEWRDGLDLKVKDF